MPLVYARLGHHPPLCDKGFLTLCHAVMSGWSPSYSCVLAVVDSGGVGALGCSAEPLAPAQRGPGGGAGFFPCPKDVTGNPYVLTVLPSVGRAALVHAPGFDHGGKVWYPMGDTEVLIDEWGEIFMERVAVPDLERARRNLERSVRRSRRAFEDYMVHNSLCKMWSFTYAEKTWTRPQVVAHVHRFIKSWREFQRRDFPYVWILEPHKDGSWHVHMAVQLSLFTEKSTLQRLWGHGIVQFDLPKVKDPGRRDMRRLSRYLSKYISKDFADDIGAGTHRYEVAEGYQPEKVSLRCASISQGFLLLALYGEYRIVWDSSRDGSWLGPNVFICESG